jgi:hypothetical protein
MNADLGIFRRLRDQCRADKSVAADEAGIVGADKLDPDPSMIRISSANLSRSRRWGNAVPLITDTPKRTLIISPSGRQPHDQRGRDRLDDTVTWLRSGDNACPGL